MSSEESINLSAFFEEMGINVDADNVSEYLQMDGSILQIDPDGIASTSGWTNVATFLGTSDTLSDTDLIDVIAPCQYVI